MRKNILLHLLLWVFVQFCAISVSFAQRVIEETIPAEYQIIKRKALIHSDSVIEVIDKPAQYEVHKKSILTRYGDALPEWREISCSDSAELARRKIIHELQIALKKLGYYEYEKLEDTFLPLLRSAMIRYQTEKGLPVGRLNNETLISLGIDNR